MTEDEAINLLKNYGRLYKLPKEFHTKEFVIKCIDIHSIFFSFYDLKRSNIKVDYDIALMRELREYKFYKDLYIFEKLNLCYSKHLTQPEIDKLVTTLRILTS